MATEHALKEYRQRRKLTQDDLAKELEVSSVTVSRWETGARKIDLELLPAISEKTGIAKGDLRPDLAAIFSSEAAA